MLGIAASPKRGGNSDLLLDSALCGAYGAGAATKKIVLNDLDFRPCQECGKCDKTGECVLCDDMRLVYRKLDASDTVIIASPIFFGSVSAQLKMMIDRFQCRWVAKYVLKKKGSTKKKRKGLFLCAAGSNKESFFNNAKSIVKNFFATLSIEYAGELFYPEANKKDASRLEEMLDEAFRLGKELVMSSEL